MALCLCNRNTAEEEVAIEIEQNLHFASLRNAGWRYKQKSHLKSGAESTSAARAWQALGAVVQHTSDNMLRSLAVICQFVTAEPLLYIGAISLRCVHIHSFWLICLCVPTDLSRPQPSVRLWLTRWHCDVF